MVITERLHEVSLHFFDSDGLPSLLYFSLIDDPEGPRANDSLSLVSVPVLTIVILLPCTWTLLFL